jgi:hypothetical protein
MVTKFMAQVLRRKIIPIKARPDFGHEMILRCATPLRAIAWATVPEKSNRVFDGKKR